MGYEYAKGYMFECGNFVDCQNMICFESMLHFERERESHQKTRYYSYCEDINVPSFYSYHVLNVIDKYKDYVANINGKNWRLFCKECANGYVLKQCKHVEWYDDDDDDESCYHGCYTADPVCCYEYDVGILGRCINHDRDVIAANPECDVCNVRQPLINFKYSKCKKCKKRVCKKCAKNGKHRRVCEKIQMKEYLVWLKKEMNKENEAQYAILGYQYYDFVIGTDCWSEYKIRGDNNSKKSLRKRMKNKRKCKKSLKQQRDKKGNAKYYKRSNQHKLFSNMLKNEM